MLINCGLVIAFGGWVNVTPVIFFLIAVILVLAASQKVLWGPERITYEQIDVAYFNKVRSNEITEDQLPLRKENNPICDLAFTVLGFASTFSIWIIFWGHQFF